MAEHSGAEDAETGLHVTLRVEPEGVRVGWRLSGVTFHEGDVLAHLPLTIAGAPTIELEDDDVAAADDTGPLPLAGSLDEDADGEPERRWGAGRTTHGTVEVSYLARPIAEEPQPAPPLELRREETGLSGALKCFLVLPPGPEDLPFRLRWDPPAESAGGMAVVSSLGEGLGTDGEVEGIGLELLGDTYVMVGDLADRHLRDGEMSTWWLTTPGIDVEAFGARLGATYTLLAETFAAPAHPYRVFLRTHPHRGANASAHPSSFVMALNPVDPLDETALYETLAHELVHEWLRLDGPVEDVTWFVEGAADYYSLVLPLRAGLVEEDAFLQAVNFEARECYANVRRDLGIREAQQVFFTDFMAHRLPYARGLFYLADLEARLSAATSDSVSVDDIVRDVVRRRARGERVGLDAWCAIVEDVLGETEMPALDALVLTGQGRPGEDCFGSRFEQETLQVPVLDLGFDPDTLITGRVRGLVDGGLADRAGLREGEVVDLPRYSAIVRMDAGDVLSIGVTRDGGAARIDLPLGAETAAVPQWSKRPDGAVAGP
jgi:predicted metalloprotease with PDZ domain